MDDDDHDVLRLVSDDDEAADDAGAGGWTLSDLLRPRDDVRRRDPPSPSDVRRLVRSLSDEWLDESVDMTNLLSWCMDRFRLDPSGDFTFADFERASTERHYQFAQVNLFCRTVQERFPDGEMHPLSEDASLLDSIVQVERVIASTHRTCLESLVLFNRMEAVRTIRLPPPLMDEETIHRQDPNDLSSFQRLVLFFLKRFEARGFRKCGNACFERVRTRDGHPTPTYRFVSTIRDEVWSAINKDVTGKEWKDFTNPRDNPKACVDYLTHSNDVEFPPYDVGDGEWYSFENGVLNVRHDFFVPFDREAEWPSLLDALWRRRVRHRLRTDDRWRDDPQDEDALDEAACPWPVPDRATVAVNHFDVSFRFDMEAEPDDFDATSIHVPALHRIMDAQDFEPDTKLWMAVMLGRLLFPLHKYDFWARCLMVIGAGGTGKSTLMNWMMFILTTFFYSLMMSNFQEQFGWADICKKFKRCCFNPELVAKLKVRQEDWQVFVEGGRLGVAVKGEESFEYDNHHGQTLMHTGNQFPTDWDNGGKQVSRRSTIFMFRNLIQKAALDLTIQQELKDDVDMGLRWICACYMSAARRFGEMDLEAPGVLPEQVRAWCKTMETTVDPLHALLEGESLELDPEHYMPMESLKQMYMEFRRNNGHHVRAWTRDLYSSVFQSFGLHVKRTTKVYEGRTRSNIDFVLGVRPRREDGDDEYANGGGDGVMSDGIYGIGGFDPGPG